MEICRDFLRNNCNNTNCTRIHDKNACRHFYLKGFCKFSANECKFKHYNVDEKENKCNIKIKKHHKHIKNTETFEPFTGVPDVRVVFCDDHEKLNVSITPLDIVLVPNIICQRNDLTIYNKLLEEMEATGFDQEKLFKLWHGNSHMIVDDQAYKWKEMCPTFNMIVDKLAKYFNMKVNSTRFNFYQDSMDHKPFHFDAAAIKPHIAKVQNFTVGISFGACRDITFEHDKTRNIVSFPLFNGQIYCFSRDINVKWRHGVPQLPANKQHNNGRISIILWGWIDLVEYNDLNEIFIK
jgi:hypothetical protein